MNAIGRPFVGDTRLACSSATNPPPPAAIRPAPPTVDITDLRTPRLSMMEPSGTCLDPGCVKGEDAPFLLFSSPAPRGGRTRAPLLLWQPGGGGVGEADHRFEPSVGGEDGKDGAFGIERRIGRAADGPAEAHVVVVR